MNLYHSKHDSQNQLYSLKEYSQLMLFLIGKLIFIICQMQAPIQGKMASLIFEI